MFILADTVGTLIQMYNVLGARIVENISLLNSKMLDILKLRVDLAKVLIQLDDSADGEVSVEPEQNRQDHEPSEQTQHAEDEYWT